MIPRVEADYVPPPVEELEQLILATMEAAARIMGLDHRPTDTGTVTLGEEWVFRGVGPSVWNSHARVPRVDISVANTRLDFGRLLQCPEANHLREIVEEARVKVRPRSSPVLWGSVFRTIIYNGADPWVRGTLSAFAREEATRLHELLGMTLTKVVASAPVMNFDCPGEDRVQLSSWMWLRRLSSEERAWLLSDDGWKRGHSTLLGLTDVRWTTWALEMEYYPPEALSGLPMHESEDLNPHFDSIISALRLFKDANVGRCEISCFEEPLHRPMYWHTVEHCSTRIDHEDLLYVLGNEEIPLFRAFLSQYCKEVSRKDMSPLAIAIPRYNDTFYHQRDWEREIDCVMALEALLGTRGDNLADRFALRGSALFSLEPGRQGTIYKLLRAAYDQRSRMLHQGRPPEEATVDVLVRFTRRAIKTYMDFPSFMRHKGNYPFVDEYAKTRPQGVTIEQFVLDRLKVAGRSS